LLQLNIDVFSPFYRLRHGEAKRRRIDDGDDSGAESKEICGQKYDGEFEVR
jgi:hypothetical protein